MQIKKSGGGRALSCRLAFIRRLRDRASAGGKSIPCLLMLSEKSRPTRSDPAFAITGAGEAEGAAAPIFEAYRAGNYDRASELLKALFESGSCRR